MNGRSLQETEKLQFSLNSMLWRTQQFSTIRQRAFIEQASPLLPSQTPMEDSHEKQKAEVSDTTMLNIERRQAHKISKKIALNVYNRCSSRLKHERGGVEPRPYKTG